MSNSNKGNYNYLNTIPSQQYTPSYQQTQQQYPLQQQAQVMGPNGQMVNIPELDQSIARFEEIKPQTEFREIRAQLPIALNNYYKKYFDYLETIKQRRGQDEYLSGLRKILNKMNEYVSKTEKTIINLKKTLDYTEATLPIQPQYSINGRPQPQNTFIIPELQNVVEKDNNIEFVDIFGLKKQNMAHLSPENRNLILLVVQSLMGFPPIIPSPKLNDCLKILDETIKGIERDNFLNTEKQKFDIIEGDPTFQPLVKVDIYSKLFSIFENGNLNIKDIKTDKIDDKIVETTPNKSSSSSPYSSPYSSYGYSSYNSYGGSPYQFFGSNQKRNSQQPQQGKPQQSSQPQGKSNKIKKILKYELPSTNTTSNTEYELQSLLKKKGIDITNYSFLNEEMIEDMRKISPKQNTNSSNLKNQQSQQNSINLTITTGGGLSVKRTKKTGQQSNQKVKELHGYQVIKLVKDDKRLRDTLKTGKIDDFITKLEESFKTKQKKHIPQLSYGNRITLENEKERIINEIKQLNLNKISELNNTKKKEIENQLKLKNTRLQIIKNQLGIGDNLRYTKAQIQKVVQELNLFLKDIIERKYPKRILKCGEESFGTMTRTVLDFFTNMTDKITIKESPYDKLKKNDESKSIYFIQMYYMMYETYLDYYRTYTIEKISKSFTKNTLASDNQLKLRILNGLGVYSVIIYRKLKEVLDKIKEILLMVSPDFGKAMDMLSKVQTLLNSSANEAKKEKLLKIKKDILNEIAKLTNNKKTNQKQNGRDKFGNGRDKFNKFDKFGNGRDKFDKFENRKPFNKFGEKKKFERYKKQENNNVSL